MSLTIHHYQTEMLYIFCQTSYQLFDQLLQRFPVCKDTPRIVLLIFDLGGAQVTKQDVKINTQATANIP